MGDQQQKIEALRAAMTSIQERDPNAPVPDFLMVDTSTSTEPADAEPVDSGSANAGSTGAGPVQSAPVAAVQGAARGAGSEAAGPEASGPRLGGPDPDDPEFDGPEFGEPELSGIESADLEFTASAEARPLVEPDQPPGATAPLDADAHVQAPAQDEAETEAEADDHAEASSGAMAELTPEEQYEKARSVVLRRLTGSPKSRHQLAVALKEKEFTPETITRVLDRMEEVHLVNDAEFARTWVRGRHELKNLGKSALRRELREKGISEQVAADALEQISAEDEGDAARQLVQRKLQGKSVPTGPSPEERAERDKVTRRLVSMLARRGHAPGAAFQIVREVIDDHSNA